MHLPTVAVGEVFLKEKEKENGARKSLREICQGDNREARGIHV